MLTRTLEPIPEDLQYDAEAYLAMDHREVNRRFVEDLIAGGPVGPRVLDMGCGPALIPILLCEKVESLSQPTWRDSDESFQVMAIDNSIEMLELARFEIELGSRQGQVILEHIDMSDSESLQDDIAHTVINNTVLHHLPDPIEALRLAIKAVAPGGRLFFRDLCRPASEAELDGIVESVTGGPPVDMPEIDPHMVAYQRQLFRQSLHAALTLEEARDMAKLVGLEPECVQMTSDRHWTLDAIVGDE